MKTTIIEAEHKGRGLWGKFLVGVFDEEWHRRSELPDNEAHQAPLLSLLGWAPKHFLVVDLSVGHGAIFSHGGSARHDVTDKQIYFCPLFADFMTWLYQQDLSDLASLPTRLDLARYQGWAYLQEAATPAEP